MTLIQPGAFPTGVASRMVKGEDADRLAGYKNAADLKNAIEETFTRIFSGPDLPDPQLVADAVRALVESPVGTRPRRVVIDPLAGAMIETLNLTHADVQDDALELFGMSALVSKSR